MSMSKTGRRDAALTLALPADAGMDAGFGGVRGANRQNGQVETLPAAKPADYGKGQGLNPAYGSRASGVGRENQITNKR